MKRILTVYCCLTMSFLSSAQVVKKLLIARNTATKVLASGESIRMFGFAESLGAQPKIPGPTLYFNEGDSVDIELFNVSQGAPHTIHLHGLDVDQANDGVPHLSFEVGHMTRGHYKFVAPHAGTYLYHCHVVSVIHVQAGMYGLLVVKAKGGENKAWTGGPEYGREYNFLTSEIDTNWHTDSVLLHDHNDTMALQIPVPKFKPQYFLVNGLSDGQITDNNLDDMRGKIDGLIRLGNIGFTQVVVTFPSYLQSEIIASDGRPLPISEKTTTVSIFPGERYDVMIYPPDSDFDSISFQFFDMNTGVELNQQWLPYHIFPAGSVHDSKAQILKVKVFPNPTNGEINIAFDPEVGGIKSIDCQDITGRYINFKNIDFPTKSNQQKLVIEDFTGIVLIRILFDDGSSSVHKVFVR